MFARVDLTTKKVLGKQRHETHDLPSGHVLISITQVEWETTGQVLNDTGTGIERSLPLLQKRKKEILNIEVKKRVKAGVLSDQDKALSVGLGIYDAAVPGLSQQAKDWIAAHIAASNVVQIMIYDSTATVASVDAIDPINDPVWPDVTNYPLILV